MELAWIRRSCGEAQKTVTIHCSVTLCSIQWMSVAAFKGRGGRRPQPAFVAPRIGSSDCDEPDEGIIRQLIDNLDVFRVERRAVDDDDLADGSLRACELSLDGSGRCTGGPRCVGFAAQARQLNARQ